MKEKKEEKKNPYYCFYVRRFWCCLKEKKFFNLNMEDLNSSFVFFLTQRVRLKVEKKKKKE